MLFLASRLTSNTSYHGRLSVAKKDPPSHILPPMTVFISPPLFFRSSRARLNWKPFLLTFGRWNFRCSTGLNSTCRDHRHNNHDYLRLWCASAGSADHWESAGLAPQGHDLQVWTTFHICSASFLSEPGPIIVYPSQWLTDSLTHDLLELMPRPCWRWNVLTLADGIKYLSNAEIEM